MCLSIAVSVVTFEVILFEVLILVTYSVQGERYLSPLLQRIGHPSILKCKVWIPQNSRPLPDSVSSYPFL